MLFCSHSIGIPSHVGTSSLVGAAYENQRCYHDGGLMSSSGSFDAHHGEYQPTMNTSQIQMCLGL